MTKKIRLNDYTRVKLGNGITVETRSSTGRGSRFGSAQNLWLQPEEARQLYEILDAHYGGDGE